MQGHSFAPPAITDGEFRALRTWIHERAGIHLSDQKKALVTGRLNSRLRHHRLTRFQDYCALLHDDRFADEVRIAVDLLTTNETSFFREPRHFEFLRERIVPAHAGSRCFRVWSAACSSGEEPYTIGMTLASSMGDAAWEVLASDLSSRVLERARSALYAMERGKNIPRAELHAHCLKGTGRHDGTFMLAEHVTRRVQFSRINLNEALPPIGEFDVILLRNVMIYFNNTTKQQVVDRVVAQLRGGGHLMIGHSESLTGIRTNLAQLGPSIYRKP
jgi:chemotaxis protein methyltransferase CheR